MNLFFSFIIPVYNRPDEVGELLESLTKQTFAHPFEIVIIEDGSTKSSHLVIDRFKPSLNIHYLEKPNSGPGDSRNYGMSRAKGDYFIILDSDCILPPRYLETVSQSLHEDFVHCYGGPDAAHESFSLIQKAINYAMTAVLTTGGIRGGARDKSFQPRSFNMGLSRLAFESTGGFGNIHPGEDPDLIFRIWGQGYATRLIPEAFVFHKRRIGWKKFYEQVQKFGMVRPILNRKYPKTAKMTYWFPTLFCLGFLFALLLGFWGVVLPLVLYAAYFFIIFIDSLMKNRNLAIALLSLFAVGIQFIGYGFGFLKSAIFINFSEEEPEKLFPHLFFPKTDTAV